MFLMESLCTQFSKWPMNNILRILKIIINNLLVFMIFNLNLIQTLLQGTNKI
jgi:hypothetical protein